MPNVLVRHRVVDFEKWEPYFDRDAERRAQYGLGAGHLYRNVDDPQQLVILFEAEDIGRARDFIQSEELRKVMGEAGVISVPEVMFLDEIGQFAANEALAARAAA